MELIQDGYRVIRTSEAVPSALADKLVAKYTINLNGKPFQLVHKTMGGRLEWLSGFTGRIVAELAGEAIPVGATFPGLPKANFAGMMEFDDLVEEVCGFHLRDIQRAAIMNMGRVTNASASIFTGGGKSLVVAGLCWLSDSALVIVNSVTLAQQLHKTLSKFFGEHGSVGFVGHAECVWRPITVAVMQSIANKPKLSIQKFQTVIVDEVHNAASPTFVETLLRTDAKFCYGVSATVTRTKQEEALILEALTGPCVLEVSGGEIPVKDRVNYKVHLAKVKDHRYALATTAELLPLMVGKKWKGLILVDSIEEGRKLGYEFMPLLSSHNSREYVEKELEKLKNGEHRAIIATQIFDEGIDIPELNIVINLKRDRTFIATMQSMGRIMRGCTQPKLVVDFLEQDKAKVSDKMSAYLRQDQGRVTIHPSAGEMYEELTKG